MDERPEVQRLDDEAVEARLAWLDGALGQLEKTPGRTAELALEIVGTLTEVYGEALTRVTDIAAGNRRLLDGLTADELLRHMLLLHRIHPDPPQQRVAQAVEDLRPQLRSQGAEAELVDVQDGVARINLSSRSCGGCGTALHELIREHVLTVVPELSGVDILAPQPTPTLIPVAALGRRVAETGGVPAREERAQHRPGSLARGGTG
jgi:Fe-S cluster biogenesis protein NfuA